jgi:hypothetical protein
LNESRLIILSVVDNYNFIEIWNEPQNDKKPDDKPPHDKKQDDKKTVDLKLLNEVIIFN